ncbi:arabinose 5-phosphate isomerase [Agarivorans sp. OAG1]|uniref:KpsF/GutQ family sugar-phosphate isomerase n=1 Tax=unclassified Agarivorans TaxID=2636026 RepID=UPI0014065967|nr:KpsF/GutQ family sugar-phosphate isomerase [Agarivorans sp. B2Z047]MPW28364.1 KpsF/GutQ family sugar-phosphate isomerase [Agarivorans sp. B2Z047]UQN43813.1 KpsF/GutQ family sugar-phosphate isomerase [Agarivorans sp. B2Z047]BEU04758.1 arabinose 5-phosphate isomerase [Agarivorans sp. OAG1]
MSFDYIAVAKRVLEIESLGIDNLHQYIDQEFAAACEMILACKGKVILTGMGKSGHIANKIAATLASTGTPAFFVHPGEACHGDLGMIAADDIVLALSNSGESEEILSLYPVFNRIGVRSIAMTSNPNSSMAKQANYHLCISVPREACPLGLAPTASSTATLVMGDALAVALLEARGFTADDFALSHPGGTLGKKLLLSVSDLMLTGEQIPLVTVEQTIREALFEITAKGLGMVGVLDSKQQLAGIFTDGDLRRILDQRIDIHDTQIGQVMTQNPKVIDNNWLAFDALKLMKTKSINGLFVLNNKAVVGAFNMHTLLQAGVY